MVTQPTLRADQMETVQRLRAALAVHQSVLLRGPCGFGKTVLAAYMASGADKKNKRVIFGVHRRELARQTAATFQKFGIPFGYIMAGQVSNPLARVQIASVDTLRNRPAQMGCDLFIPDEAHLWSGPSRQEVIDHMRKSGAHLVPLTATPTFPDGRPLTRMADTIIHGPSEAWLIKNGFLAKYRAFAPSHPDMTGIHSRGGEYVVSDLDEKFGKPAIYGDAVAAYRKFANGRRHIGYCYSRKHGHEMADTFNAAGIPSAFVDGETPDGERRAAITAFADGQILALFNAQLFREGFDLSAQVGRNVPIQSVGLYSPTQSLTMAIQMMMRGMRPQDGYTVILDHANVLRDHGFPDDEREWTLDGEVGAKKSSQPTIPTVTCGTCWSEYRPNSSGCCPYCGGLRDIQGRLVASIEAELEEIDPDLVREARRLEEAKINQRIQATRKLDDLAALGIELGKSAGWLWNLYRHRSDGKRSMDYGEAVRAMSNAKRKMENA